MKNKKTNKNSLWTAAAVLGLLLCSLLLMGGCSATEDTKQPALTETGPTAAPAPTEIPINPDGTTIKDRFVPPDGFTRIEAEAGSFGEYLQNFELKPYGENAYYYDDTVNEQGGTVGVFNQNVTRWQQCADSIMRLHAEYLFEKGEYDKISYNFTAGFQCDFANWRQGKRVKVSGSKCAWVQKADPSTTKDTLESYLDFVYQYANTESLQNQLIQVSPDDIKIGDSFIITSYQMEAELGHAVFVADMAQNEAGEKIYLIFEGTTPASQICLAKSNDSPYGYWLGLKDDGTLEITKTVYDTETESYKEKTWVCPGKYIRRFAE